MIFHLTNKIAIYICHWYYHTITVHTHDHQGNGVASSLRDKRLIIPYDFRGLSHEHTPTTDINCAPSCGWELSDQRIHLFLCRQ